MSKGVTERRECSNPYHPVSLFKDWERDKEVEEMGGEERCKDVKSFLKGWRPNHYRSGIPLTTIIGTKRVE